MGEDDEIIREFLIESGENLNRLDSEIVDLERSPTPERLGSIFRTIHTIKGTCGFLGFQVLENITHHAENILSQLRGGRREVTGEIVSLILETVDAVRQILSCIENEGNEGSNTFGKLIERLERAVDDRSEVKADEVTEEENCSGASKDHTPDGHGVKPVASGPAEHERASIADSAIRVDVSLLDKLMSLVSELVLIRNQISQFTQGIDNANLTSTSQRLNLITSELQESVMKTRMQPAGVIFNKFPRVVRDIAHSLGKQIELEIEGADTELDKTIVEAIKDPLTHLIRNSCDHGIESPEARLARGKPANGVLRLKAYHESGRVTIELTDDGAGVDVERVKAKALEKGLIRQEQAARLTEREAISLLFLPGFSTAQAVTNVSGRGVGMDVVKSNIEKIGGSVDLSTVPGKGTCVRLKIPLTLAIIPGLVVRSGGHRFVIPQISLLELVRLEGEALNKIAFIHETQVFRRRGSLLPMASLNEVLNISGRQDEIRNLVILQADDRQFGLVVDGIEDTQEIVVKPLGKYLKGLNCYSGATIMGDGTVALILDVMGIGQRAGLLDEAREKPPSEPQAQQTADKLQTERLLLFKSGDFDGLAVPLSLVARLEVFSAENIEHAGGSRVVQYRDQILPLIPLSSVIGSGKPKLKPDTEEAQGLQVVVLGTDGRMLGLIVDEIVDVVEDVVTMRNSSSGGTGILGSAVACTKVTDFLDLEQVIELSGEQDTASEARRKMETEPVKALVTGAELLASDHAKGLRDAVASAQLPILALASSADEMAASQQAGFAGAEYQLRTEREEMLKALARLTHSVTSATVESALTPAREREFADV